MINAMYWRGRRTVAMADLLIDPVHSDTTEASSASPMEPWPISRMVMLSSDPPMELATAMYGRGRRTVALADSELPVAATLGGAIYSDFTPVGCIFHSKQAMMRRAAVLQHQLAENDAEEVEED